MTVDSQGKWTGLDVDICRDVSAAIFGDSEKVKYVPLSGQPRFTALQSGEVDVLSNNSTWTLTRDSAIGLDFVGVTYYDGQGFMVPKKLGLKSAKELNGASICVLTGSTSELNIADYFRTNKMTFKPVLFEDPDQSRSAFFTGRCDAYSGDQARLYATRAANAPKPDDYIVLPEIISKEPLGPAVRHGDHQFADIVRWAQYAMLEAEEYGITSKNVDEMLKSDNPSIKRILGVTPGMGKALGRRREVGLHHRQAGRELRRELRPQCRHGHAAQGRSRPERALDQGRPALRAADSLTTQATSWLGGRTAPTRSSRVQDDGAQAKRQDGRSSMGSQARCSQVAADEESGGQVVRTLQRLRAERAQNEKAPLAGDGPSAPVEARSTRARMAQAGSIAGSGVPA